MKRILLAAAALVLTAGIAQAATPSLTATLAAASAKTAIVTDHTVWKCAATACTTRSLPRESNNVFECQLLAQKSGAAVTAYGAEGDMLDADRLAKCNAK